MHRYKTKEKHASCDTYKVLQTYNKNLGAEIYILGCSPDRKLTTFYVKNKKLNGTTKESEKKRKFLSKQYWHC